MVSAVLLGCSDRFCIASPAGKVHWSADNKAFRRGDWAQAEGSFRAVLRERPGSPTALKWLGMVYAAQQKFEPAEARRSGARVKSIRAKDVLLGISGVWRLIVL